MKAKRLKYYQEKLEELYRKELAVADTIKEGLRSSQGDSIGEISLYDNHPGDVGDTTFEREKDLGFMVFSANKLDLIKKALLSVEQGSYGQCKSCGSEIDEERLEAIPYTELCQDCKKESENRENFSRPVEEKVINPPFGSYYTKGSAFDGEDTWQAVARYGTSNSPSDIGSVDDYDDTYIHSFEDAGNAEDVDAIDAYRDKDGQLYKDFRGRDDESSPGKQTDE